jgi:hypothetical protein
MIAAVSIASGLPPAVLLREDPEMVATLIEILSERRR